MPRTDKENGLPRGTKDLRGQTFGDLYVFDYAGSKQGNGALWHCVCHCCNEIEIIYGRHLRSGKRKRCKKIEITKGIPTAAKNSVIRTMYPLFGSQGVIMGIYKVWGFVYTANQITEAASRLGVRAHRFKRGPRKGTSDMERKEQAALAAMQERDAFHQRLMIMPATDIALIPWKRRFDSQRSPVVKAVVMGCSAVR